MSSTWNVFSDACSRGMLGCSSLISQFSRGNYKWLGRNTAEQIMLDSADLLTNLYGKKMRLRCTYKFIRLCSAVTHVTMYTHIRFMILWRSMFLHFHTFSALRRTKYRNFLCRASKNCMEGLPATPTADWISIVDSHMTLLLIQILYQDFVRHIFPQQNDLSLG